MKAVKIIIIHLITGFSLLCAAPSEWHTASGNSYVIYETFEWAPKSKENKNPGTLFFISYQTQVTDKNDKAKFLSECEDVLTHYYYFYLPSERKSMNLQEKKNHHVVIRAFFKPPELGRQNQSVNFTKNINAIETIVMENKNIDVNRVAEIYHRAQKFQEAVKYYEMALKDLQGRVPASVQKDEQVKKIEAQLKLAQQNKPL